MTEIRLTTLKHPIPVDELKPRQETSDLTKRLIALAEELVAVVKKEKRELMFPVDNLPPGMIPKRMQTKVYAMKLAGKIPEKIFPALRTVTVKDEKTGAVVRTEMLYLRYGEPGKTMKKGA